MSRSLNTYEPNRTLPTYLQVHFTKVGDQTRDMLRTTLEQGRAANLPIDALAEIAEPLLAPPRIPRRAPKATPALLDV